MTDPTTGEIVVVQADRDVAAALLDRIGGIQRFEKFGVSFAAIDNAFCGALARHRIEATREAQAEQLNDIAVMMSEFVDNWPEHKKFSTSLALIAKTLRASRAEAREAQAVLPGEIGALVERLRRAVPVLRSWGMSSTAPLVKEAADALTALQGRVERLEAENADLRGQLRENVPYSADEIEVFQRCLDRGVLTLEDLRTGSRDEKVERARVALSTAVDGKD